MPPSYEFCKIPPVSCSVSAWMTPGHAFVDFNCGEEMRRTVGFAPDESYYINNLESPPLLNWALGSSGLGLETTSGVQLTSGTGAYSIPQLGKSLSPGLTAQSGSSNLFSGSSSIHTINGMLLKDQLRGSPSRGKLGNDREYLCMCLNHKVPCMYKHYNVTKEVAAKAWEHMLSVEKDIQMDKQKKCSLQGSDKFKYALFSNNCIDFMHGVMKSVGDLKPKKDFQYTSFPTRLQKMTAIAWHYFNWT